MEKLVFVKGKSPLAFGTCLYWFAKVQEVFASAFLCPRMDLV